MKVLVSACAVVFAAVTAAASLSCATLHGLPERCQSPYDACLNGCGSVRARPPRPQAVSDAMIQGSAQNEGDSGECVQRCNDRAKLCARE